MHRRCGVRKLIWQCGEKAAPLSMLIDYGFGKTATGPLAAELSSLLLELLGMYDRNFDENDLKHGEGGAA